jgi:predicted phosphodiesterase
MLIRIVFFIAVSFSLLSAQQVAHQWKFDRASFKEGGFTDRLGNLDAKFSGRLRILEDEGIEYLELDGLSDHLQLAENITQVEMPNTQISIEALVRIRRHAAWLGIIGAFQDNGSFERGWVLGLNDDKYFWGVAGTIEEPHLTIISGPEKAIPGRWYYVAASYDGNEQKLYINGELVATARQQKGPIFYPESAYYTIGAYKDDNEFNVIRGSLADVRVHERVLDAAEIAEQAGRFMQYTSLPADTRVPSIITSGPYLQMAAKNSIRILWETEKSATALVAYGEQVPLELQQRVSGLRLLHEVTLTGLEPQTNYFYRVIAEAEDGETAQSDIYTFQTNVLDNTAFAFGVVSDTQNNPDVWGNISTRLFNERPNFVVHAGDIVGSGNNKREWTEEFLRPGHDLMSRIPMYIILGNHEDDAQNYYRYIANPEPEYFYTFTYGNAQFFMLDTDRSVAPGSEQHKWLERELAASDATWKFAVHHHPPYSSDEDDYGNTWVGSSTRGDQRLRPLVKLYEQHNLDICFFGHIHDYERTWPLRDDQVQSDGVVYIQTGGGGGSLENYAPTRSWFTQKVYRDHHYLFISIHDNSLFLQAIDQQGRLFDVYSKKK